MMKQIPLYSLFCFVLMVCAVINVQADQKKTDSPKPAEPTITVDGMVFPAYPEGYKELKAKINELERKIELLKNGEVDEFADERQAFEAKIQTAKTELDRLTKEWEPLENVRRESWKVLPQETQKILFTKILENPNLKVYDVKDLRPDGVSYKELAKIVRDGKAVAEPQKKLMEQKQKYENFVKDLNDFEVNLVAKLESELTATNKNLENKIGCYTLRILAEIISKHPDFDTLEAEFPFDDLIPAVSDLREQMIPYYQDVESEEDLFKTCEDLIWSSRPCVIQSEPAQISLKCWTAFMRGNYEEAEKYAGPGMQEWINNAKRDPKEREKIPVDPNFQCYIGMCIMNEKDFVVFILPGEYTETDFVLRIQNTVQFMANCSEKAVEMGFMFFTPLKDESGNWKAEINFAFK